MPKSFSENLKPLLNCVYRVRNLDEAARRLPGSDSLEDLQEVGSKVAVFQPLGWRRASRTAAWQDAFVQIGVVTGWYLQRVLAACLVELELPENVLSLSVRNWGIRQTMGTGLMTRGLLTVQARAQMSEAKLHSAPSAPLLMR